MDHSISSFLSPLQAARRRTDAQRREAVQQFRRSGLTRAAFAKRIGISTWSLSRWIGLAGPDHGRGRRSSRASEPRLQLQVFDPAASSTPAFELVVDGRYCLRIPARFDAQELRRLVAALAQPC
jgi:transposase-like protein